MPDLQCKSHKVTELHNIQCDSPEQVGPWAEWLLNNGAKSVSVVLEHTYWFVRAEIPARRGDT